MDDNRLAPKASENDGKVYVSTDAILDRNSPDTQAPSAELSDVRVDRQTTDGGQFPLGCDELVRLMDFTTTPTDKVIGVLASWGGVEGVCKKLNVDPNHGLNDNELDDPHNARKEKYGENMMPPLILPTLLEHALAAVKDVTLLCLLGAATISLAFGLYSDFTNEESEPNVHWVEGFAIFLAVFIIVVITAANNYKKDGLLRDQAAESDNIRTPVRRNGDSTDIPVHNILVGDIVLLKDGDIIPVDGLVIDSQSGKCDESSATGESDPIKKRRFDADSDCKLVGKNGNLSSPKTKGEVSEKGTDTAGEGSNTKKSTGPNPATGHVAIDIEDGPIDFSPSPKKGKSSSVPFLVQSGTKVNEGTLTVVALAVGVHSRYGQLLKEVKKEVEDTPLQKLLAQLAASIGWFGLGAALAQLVILTIKLVVKGVQGGWQNDIRWGPEGDTGSAGIVFAIINIIIQAVTIIVVAVPEGLPMAVTIALIYGTRKMAKRNNFVRQLAACETMGGATTICTDKTGTLTENRMTVVAGRIAQYVFDRTESAQVTAALTDPRKDLSNVQGAVENRLPPPSCLNLFRCAIVRNTKAFVTKDENGVPVFRGDKTESALLKLCITDMTSVDLKSERTRIERIFPFSSKRKSMTSIARSDDCAMNPDEKFHMYVKGAAEVILSSCSHYMDSAGTTQSFQNANDSFEDMAKKKEVYQLLDYYAKQSLRCIVIAYLPLTEKEYQKMQTEWEKVAADGEEPQANYGNNLVFLGIVGIEDPLRNGVDVAVRRVQNAGIVVRMVTGDNIVTATSIAMKAGILANGGICMEGTDFRQMFEEHNAFHARLAARNIENDDEQMPMSPSGAATRRDNAYTSSNVTPHLPNSQEGKTHKKANVSGWIDKIMKNDISPDEDEDEVGRGSQSRYSVEKGKMSAFDKMLPKLRVLARSSPKDKQILVEHLKSLGETVAVTGDGANDGPALKAADVGFAMGIAGSGIAKEAASIILLDDNFCSVVTAVVWGRSISDSVRKFLMFQLTVNVTAVTVAVISSIVDDASSSVLTAVQLLWVNLLMDTFGALALATDEPDEEEYLSRPPMNNKRDPLITWNMRCMIIGQAIWQIVVTLTLLYAGHKLFLLEVDNEHGRLVVRTIVFNAFVLCNIFNEVNCRRIDRVFNIFRKLHTNLIFIAIIIGTFICQFFIVHFGGDAFKTTPIGGGHWAACIFIGLLTWPLGLFIRIVFFRVSARAKAVKVDVYPTINPSWKRELLWKRAYRMALRQSRMSSNTNLGLSAQANEEDTNTMTITLPIPVYNRLRNALENNTGSAENVALGSQGQLEESRSSNPGGLAPARSLNFPIFESVVAGIAARKAENST